MAAELVWRLTGGAANANPNDSLGGTRSSVELSSTPKHNLFDKVTWQEAILGGEEFRALDLVNTGDATALDVSVWLAGDTSSPDTTLQLGADELESVLSIGEDDEAPAGISFTDPREGLRLELPDIPAGQGVRVWFRREVSENAANTANDAASVEWEFA